MLKNYKAGLDVLMESLSNLSDSLEEENLENSLGYLAQFANFFQMFSILLAKDITEKRKDIEAKEFPEYIKEDDDCE